MSEEKLPLKEMENQSLQHENLLRPKTISEYIGQKKVSSKLEVFMMAARSREEVLDHVILSGPPGLGKTTLAHIIAHEMKGRVHSVAGPSLEKSVDLLAILTNLQRGDVLFIDEIHRLSASVEESLYPAMEDLVVQLILGEGAAAQAVTVPLQPFTLVGATTQAGKLTGPLRDRFGIQLNLDFYELDEMEEILQRSARLLQINLKKEELKTIARRSRGTPRIANHLLARVRDIVDVFRGETDQLSDRAQKMLRGINKNPSDDLIQTALDFMDVDPLGLQALDRRYLQLLMGQFKGGPAGIEAIAASLSEDRRTLEEMVEPYLLKEGFILRSPRGRLATDRAYEHLGVEALSPLVGDGDLGL